MRKIKFFGFIAAAVIFVSPIIILIFRTKELKKIDRAILNNSHLGQIIETDTSRYKKGRRVHMDGAKSKRIDTSDHITHYTLNDKGLLIEFDTTFNIDSFSYALSQLVKDSLSHKYTYDPYGRVRTYDPTLARYIDVGPSNLNLQYSDYAISRNPFEERKFWIKIIFSAIVTSAALYIILSKKYDEDTKRWAFSVLSCVAGVWLGSL